VTKPLHAFGVLDLRFKGWASVDEAKPFARDLLLYEPWFIGLGVLVALGALHQHARTGGLERARRRLVGATAAATLSR
jgi:hypothetical protein